MSANLLLDIRPVQAEELETLRLLAKDTIVTAFGPYNSAEDMAAYVEAKFNASYFSKLFHQDGVHFFLAYLEGKEVAYLKLNIDGAQNEQLLENAIEIERIYVHQSYQGKGLGLELLNFAVRYGQQLDKEWVWLGVWEKNEGAIRFYQRHGFTIFSQHNRYLGDDLQLDWLMKRRL